MNSLHMMYASRTERIRAAAVSMAQAGFPQDPDMQEYILQQHELSLDSMTQYEADLLVKIAQSL